MPVLQRAAAEAGADPAFWLESAGKSGMSISVCSRISQQELPVRRPQIAYMRRCAGRSAFYPMSILTCGVLLAGKMRLCHFSIELRSCCNYTASIIGHMTAQSTACQDGITINIHETIDASHLRQWRWTLRWA